MEGEKGREHCERYKDWRMSVACQDGVTHSRTQDRRIERKGREGKKINLWRPFPPPSSMQAAPNRKVVSPNTKSLAFTPTRRYMSTSPTGHGSKLPSACLVPREPSESTLHPITLHLFYRAGNVTQVEGVLFEVGDLPCNLAPPGPADAPHLILWYRDDSLEPIYR